MTVLTLDRVVSLRDFEDFARAFSGIGKAQARMLWAGGRQLVHLTVAGVDGAAVDPGSALDKNFREALDRLRDPFQALVVETYEHLLFLVRLKVSVEPDYVRETVLAGVETALRAAFSFEARGFGQSVFLSEVMAVAQGVAGVVFVDVDALYREGQTPAPERRPADGAAGPHRRRGPGASGGDPDPLSRPRGAGGHPVSNYDADHLYRLLPAVYRQRDAEQAARQGMEKGPLRDLVEILAGQATVSSATSSSSTRTGSSRPASPGWSPTSATSSGCAARTAPRAAGPRWPTPWATAGPRAPPPCWSGSPTT